MTNSPLDEDYHLLKARLAAAFSRTRREAHQVSAKTQEVKAAVDNDMNKTDSRFVRLTTVFNPGRLDNNPPNQTRKRGAS